jgi:cation diffusion facilitator family transporter
MTGQPEPPHDGATAPAFVEQKLRAARASVVAGAFLTLLKLVAGLATLSLGMLAEAAHSALDFGAALITWVTVRVSWKPPDTEHHYGHGKFENLAALISALLLGATAGWILFEAGRRIAGRGPEVKPTVWAFLVLGISMAVDWVRSRDLLRVARRSGSQALEADALHFSTDIGSSGVVLLGLGSVVLAERTGYAFLALADSVAAIVVAGVVLFLSFRLGQRALDALLDRAPRGLGAEVASAVAGLEGTEGAPRVRVRQAGDRTFVDVELGLRRGLPLGEAERIASAARARVQQVAGHRSSVLVQLRAEEEKDASVRQKVATAVAMEGVHPHDVTLREVGGKLHADLHLELPASLSLGESHRIADRVEARILEEVPEVCRVDIHLEERGELPEAASPLDEGSGAALLERVRRIAREEIGEEGIHDVLIARTPSGLYLSCHCFFPADTSLAEAHERTDRLEQALREAMPELVRVSVHAEPRGLHD